MAGGYGHTVLFYFAFGGLGLLNFFVIHGKALRAFAGVSDSWYRKWREREVVMVHMGSRVAERVVARK